MLFMALTSSENGGTGTACFGERSSSARGIQNKNSRKRRDGFQFVPPEKMKIFFVLSALHLQNSLLQDTEKKILLFRDRLNLNCS